ncbi:MAG: aldo/keto reductase [Anaerolineae bacterium]|nr:aldo/keto reductase [Anaerolineae bacterium]
METRVLGRTGLEISRLGVGLAEIGGLDLAEAKQAAEVLNLALDSGITFFDTAACYGNSEELIGRTIAHRRAEFVLATKAGHVAGGYDGESWTAQTVRDSIDRSLKRLRTDHLDVIQLHSCDVDVLERGEVIEVLQEAKQAGKTRFIGYSGDNERALWAV